MISIFLKTNLLLLYFLPVYGDIARQNDGWTGLCIELYVRVEPAVRTVQILVPNLKMDAQFLGIPV